MQKQSSLPQIFYDNPGEFPPEFPLTWFSHQQGGTDLNRLHIHNGVEIGLCISGSGIFAVGSRLYPFTRGDVSVAFARQPHIAHSPDGSPSRWLFLTADLEAMGIGDNDNSAGLPGVFSGCAHPAIAALTQMVFEELREKKTEYTAMVRHLLAALYTAWERERRPTAYKPDAQAANPLLTAVLPALERMTTGYAQPLSVAELAQVCHFSVPHFRRSFKLATGTSPWEYLTEVRMRMARALLLETDRPVTAISEEVGYNSLSSFHRHFQKIYGQTPLACRHHTG